MPRPSYAPPALPPPDVLGPDEELVAGRRPVEEAFVARREAHRLLVVPQRRLALEKIVLHATNLRIPIVELEGGSLTALAGFDGHQGVALVVAPRRFATVEEILARAAERGEAPFVLALDSLEDPQNVGTLLRSAEAAGVHGVLFPTHRQAPLTPSAVKASAGAVEHLLLCPVDDLAGALADLRSHGLRVAGAEADAPLTARQSDLRGPLAIVVGSEGQGLGPAIRRRCDLFMRIPMRGVIGSLNAAVAGSILLFEAVAQRDPEAVGAPPAGSATDDMTPPSAPTDQPDAPALEPPPAAPKPKRTPKGLTVGPARSAAKPLAKATARAAKPSAKAAAPATGSRAKATTAAAATPARKTSKAATPATKPRATAAKTTATMTTAPATKPRGKATSAAKTLAATTRTPEPRTTKTTAAKAAAGAPVAPGPDDLLPGGPTPTGGTDAAPEQAKPARRRTPRA